MSSSSSCSFRITRTAEDLAQAISALSQRLVKLEQRQEAIELRMVSNDQEPPEEELQMLDGVEQILKECQELLQSSEQSQLSENIWPDKEDCMAA